MHSLTISVVIAAYNEGDHLARLLRSLHVQTLPPSEIIVVDDGSADETFAIAQSNGASAYRISHAGPAVARNHGASKASGDVLVFLDGDMEVASEFVECLTEPIRAQRAIGTFTRELFVGNPTNPWSRAYATIRRLGWPRLLPDDGPDTWSNFRAIDRRAFLQAGGYDDVGYGEDMTLAPKVEALAVVAPGARVWHHNPGSLFEIYENGRWIGRGHDIQEIHHPWRHYSVLRAIRLGTRDTIEQRHWTFLPARVGYHLGVQAGMIGRRLRPDRGHAK
jgi:glycosyltransferase involved in cell wall biosynthesis